MHYPAFTQDNGGIASVEPDGRPADEMYFVGERRRCRLARPSALLQALTISPPSPALWTGIIDILQQYNTRKMAETFFKGFKVQTTYPVARPPAAL